MLNFRKLLFLVLGVIKAARMSDVRGGYFI